MGAVDESQMEPESPRVGSPVKPTSPEKDTPAPAKKQLSSAQKASLARAREKARQSKLANSQAKADQEKEFAKFQASSDKAPFTSQARERHIHDRQRKRAQSQPSEEEEDKEAREEEEEACA